MKIRKTYIITLILNGTAIILSIIISKLAHIKCEDKILNEHFQNCYRFMSESYANSFSFDIIFLLSLIFIILSIGKVCSDGFDILVLKYKKSKK